MIQNLSQKEFYDHVETLTIPELEQLAHEFGTYDLTKENWRRLKFVLEQRKYLLSQMFECTSENLKLMQNAANLIKKHTEILNEKGDELYAQMSKIFQDRKHEPFSDFEVDLSLTVSFNDEHSVLHLPDDHSGSDYIKMADFLSSLHYNGRYISDNLMTFSNYCPERKEYIDRKTEFGNDILWEYYGRTHPKLLEVQITDEFHNLFDHTLYALQDIIRINDVWSEAKVRWQLIEGQTWKSKYDEDRDFVGERFTDLDVK
jgi:hypothetical protein